MITAKLIKALREETQAGVIDCKCALEEAKGDLEKAKEIIKIKGLEAALKKSHRVTSQGRIESYLHHNHKLGVLLEVNCETDFVAKNQEFITFCRDVAMHIAAAAPFYIKKEDVPDTQLQEHKEDKDFLKKACLLEQPFIKDDKVTIGNYLSSVIAKTGENIIISRFKRFQVGVE